MIKALVVDDSKAIRMILARSLMELGCEVSQAGDGREALDMIAAGLVPELLLADWNMPEVTGFELLQEIRTQPRFDSMVVVMVTTETEIGHMQAALEAGANEYVMKPFTKEVLIDKLRITGILPMSVA